MQVTFVVRTSASPGVVYTNTVKAHILDAVAGRLGGYRVVMLLRDIVSGPARVLLRTVGFVFTNQRIAISKAVAGALVLPKTVIVPNPLDLRDYAVFERSGRLRSS